MSNEDEKMVEIEVDGIALRARPGQMLIEVTDQADIYVPRFCYHEKLSIAANCRMCLVDVEKAPKPLPACATPVTDGMKVFTRSARAVSAQKATMEFLLINHPLDCPICDQGGECELQDLAIGYGRGVSRYTERKRVVKDKNLGPLISTDMTRCIHCTRCVRFGQEVAGIQELGAVGRSENMEIGTYIEKSVDHELSGNVIDLCPVGALNNKPYRFSARPWEMVSRPMVSPHDCLGSNLYGHVLRGRVRRVVPRRNESINETWLSDRDRFGCFGIESEDRVQQPMIKVDQEWQEVSWETALNTVCEALRNGIGGEGDALGTLVSPSATLEEMYLLRRIAGHLRSRNIDYRLRRQDFADQDGDPVWPALGCRIEEIDTRDGILFIGSDLRSEVPMLAHRVRRAALEAGAEVGFVNLERYTYHFPVAGYTVAEPESFVQSLASVVAAAAEASGADVPANVASLVKESEVADKHRATARVLIGKSRGLLLLGAISQRHPQFSSIRALASALANVTDATLGYISEGANSAGAALAGCLPHRAVAGAEDEAAGLDAMAMLGSPRRVYLLFGLDPDADLIDPDLAHRALTSADTVVSFSPFASDALRECADVLLPIGTFAETSGTYINAEGTAQSFAQAANLVGEARSGWRVLRVLGNLLGVDDCEYYTSEEIRDELLGSIGAIVADNAYRGEFRPLGTSAEGGIYDIDVNIYAVDSLVRRSEPLQQTALAVAGQQVDVDEVRSA